MRKIEIKSIDCTSSVLPTQFEGKSVDGEDIYIRHRSDKLSISVGGKYILENYYLEEPVDFDELQKIAEDIGIVFPKKISDVYEEHVGDF